LTWFAVGFNILVCYKTGGFMSTYELIAPCHFGLEAVLKKEIYDLGYDIKTVEDGKVTFEGDAEAICRANIGLRTAERVLLKVGQFKAYTFTELFDQTKALPWEALLPENANFWVTKANSVNSKLFSSSDVQSIVKKAIVERLKEKYHVDWFKEDGSEYPIRVTIIKDVVTIALDTTGDSLHKRGYRPASGKAPISESLAAALIMVTPWHKDRILVDPFCGSGTIPIEAAMIAANIAPGLNRDFTAENWENIIPKKEWYDAVEEANDNIDRNIQTDIQGFDIDESVIRIARQNAVNAGVDKLIHFQKRDVCDLSHPKKYGFIITNPPYGERLEEKEALPAIYGALGRQFAKLDDWSAYVITSYEEIEKYFGRKADKNRKIYNGMLKTYFYSFLGPKPPKRKDIHIEK
jgi:putative N6-adenine-specific DNA methylase